MRNSILTLQALKKKQQKIVMVTAYDAWMAKLVEDAVDCILIGDSLGMVIQGGNSTLSVTLDEIIYHSKMVAIGSKTPFLIADLPFLSYQVSIDEAVFSAGRCLKEANVQAVKLEGGFSILPQMETMVQYGIPVVGHLGLTPQSVNLLGGFQKQAKTKSSSKKLLEEAKAIQEVGACMLVLENIPHELAKKVTESLDIPTIGIGAGKDCDGQVQVFHDLLGLEPDFKPKHATRFMEGGTQIKQAIEQYSNSVRSKEFISQ